jgi:hydroxymethylpyrimidine/phosphomethylpyrimidine kinase
MARGLPVERALAAAQDYTSGALANAQRFGMGKCIPNRFYRLGAAIGTLKPD